MADVTRVECERFLAQVQAHHRVGDYYPDPTEIGDELRLPRETTQAVVETLRGRGWLGRSPYHADQVRITPRGWERLRRDPGGKAGVDRLIGAAPTPQERVRFV